MRILGAALSFAILAGAAHALQLGDLPGEDVGGSEEILKRSLPKIKEAPVPPPRNGNWLAPSVEEQLARDRTLITLGKGALFVPTFTEPRREPEITIFNARGREVRSGQAGERILLDSGTYSVRLGSGTTGQQIRVEAVIEEAHTTVVPPVWGGLIVETLDQDGNYIEGEYELIRMVKWVNYGKGRGLTEERLQDIKTWIVPPGLYRLSKTGEGFTSLRNYITVQINPGELTPVELIFNKLNGDIVSGGLKAFSTRARVGRNWTYGLRAAGNLNLSRETKNDDVRKEALQVSSDLRLRAIFDNALYLGTSEILLQDNFAKERHKPFSVLSDIAQFRTNWVRRLNAWLGPYVRGTAETHVFRRYAEADTFYVFRRDGDSTVAVLDTSNNFEVEPSFDPLRFGEGVGVNVEIISKYYLDASTQFGLAARQTLATESFVASTTNPLDPGKPFYSPGESVYEIGAENTVNARLRLGNQVTLDLRTEIFAPNANFSRLRLDDLTADFRFFLSQNLEIGYIYHVAESQQTNTANRYPSTHNLSLRLSFNY